MKRLILGSLIALGCGWAAWAEEVLQELSWKSLKDAGRLAAGQLEAGQPPAPAEQLKIVHDEDGEKVFHVVTIDSPGITSSHYAVTGQVRYEQVAGKGYLEMWNYFPGDGQYFSRTLGSSGPMQCLEGSCDWRPFALPFFINQGTARPNKLEINVVLPGRGSVCLGPLRLVQYAGGENALAVPGQWWDAQTGGLVGGIGGGVLGCLGALLGTLGGLGKARRFVMGLGMTVLLVGLAALAAGLVAIGCGQPYPVYYPLLLGGIICTLVMGGCLPVLRRRYEQDELRRISAMDAAAHSP